MFMLAPHLPLIRYDTVNAIVIACLGACDALDSEDSTSGAVGIAAEFEYCWRR